MKIGIGLFTYDRPTHTLLVLEGLKKNKIQKLYIFQDGLKNKERESEWLEVRRIINNVDWCSTEIICAPENKGLANSIIYGVNYMFKSNDAVIVLEDDCVPSEYFIEYMTQCFNKYQESSQVMSVSGYAWPIKVPQGYQGDFYFSYRACPWGWGTWKNRWNLYNRDYNLLKQIKSNEDINKRFLLSGGDLEKMLCNNLSGKVDSWYIFWTLTIILNEGYCINPIKSYIENIGFDGTGVHCNVTDKFKVMERNNKKTKLDFNIEIKENDEIIYQIKEIFNEGIPLEERLAIYNDTLISWLEAIVNNNMKIDNNYLNNKKIYIYGVGKIAQILLDYIEKDIKIEGFIQKEPTEKYFRCYEVYNVHDIKYDDNNFIIIIPEYDSYNIKETLRAGRICKENNIVLLKEFLKKIHDLNS